VRNLVLFLSFAVLVPGCGNPGELGIQERETISREVRTMLHNYFDDIRSGGLMAEFKYLDESEDFFWVPPGYASALTLDSVRTILQLNSEMSQSFDFIWEELRVVPLEAGTAAYTGIVAGTITDSTGAESRTRIIETGVVIKRADGWKILCGQSRSL